MTSIKKIFKFSTIWVGLASLLGEHRSRFFSLLKHVFTDYLFRQYGRKPAIFVDTLLDKDICLYPEAIGTYFDFVPLLLGNLGYLKRAFGIKIKDDMDKFLGDLIDLYINAGFVFKNAPTTLKGRGNKGFGLTVLHFLDRPRNYFPSLIGVN